MRCFSLAPIILTLWTSSASTIKCRFIVLPIQLTELSESRELSENRATQCRSMEVDVENEVLTSHPTLELATCISIARLYQSSDESLYIVVPAISHATADFSGMTSLSYWGNGTLETLKWSKINGHWHLYGTAPWGVTRESVKARLASIPPYAKLVGCSEDCTTTGPLSDMCDMTIDCPSEKLSTALVCETLTQRIYGSVKYTWRPDLQTLTRINQLTISPKAANLGPDFRWSDVDVEAIRAQQWEELKALNATYCSNGGAPRDTSHTAEQATGATTAGTMAAAIGTGVAGLAVGLGGDPGVSGGQASSSPGPSRPLKDAAAEDYDDDADDAKEDAENLLEADIGVGVNDREDPNFAVFLAY